MSKLWQKTTNVNELVENFTVGRDREFDEQMAASDVLGSLAHTEMLASAGLLSAGVRPGRRARGWRGGRACRGRVAAGRRRAR